MPVPRAQERLVEMSGVRRSGASPDVALRNGTSSEGTWLQGVGGWRSICCPINKLRLSCREAFVPMATICQLTHAWYGHIYHSCSTHEFALVVVLCTVSFWYQTPLCSSISSSTPPCDRESAHSTSIDRLGINCSFWFYFEKKWRSRSQACALMLILNRSERAGSSRHQLSSRASSFRS